MGDADRELLSFFLSFLITSLGFSVYKGALMT